MLTCTYIILCDSLKGHLDDAILFSSKKTIHYNYYVQYFTFNFSSFSHPVVLWDNFFILSFIYFSPQGFKCTVHRMLIFILIYTPNILHYTVYNYICTVHIQYYTLIRNVQILTLSILLLFIISF